LNVVKK